MTRKILLATALCAACGGTSSNTALTGNVAFQAVAVSGYQSFRGQADFPYAALQLALPKTSPFLRAKTADRRLADAPTFFPDLGLYFTTSTGAGKATLSFFSDAAATAPAGTIVLSGLPGDLGTYPSFPVTLDGTVNITAGTVPCTGSMTITLSDAVGKNTLKGNLSLPKTSVAIDFNFTLDDEGNVGGSSVITEHGSTITMSGISGGLAADAITGGVTVQPSGWTGTGTFSLATGEFSVVLATGSGSSQASSNASGGLDLTFADGTEETISAPLNTQPDAPIVTSNPDAGGTVNGYTTVALPGFQFTAKGANGAFGGVIFSAGLPMYVAPGSSTPVALKNNSAAQGVPYGINLHGAIVGVLNQSNQGFNFDKPTYWASSSAAPTTLALLPGDIAGIAVSINASGQIVAAGYDGFFHHLVYYSSPTAAPVLLATVGVGTDNFGHADGYPLAISDNGVIAGDYVYASGNTFLYDAYVWPTPTSKPVKLAAPAGDRDTQVLGVNASGAIVGSSSLSYSDSNPLHAVYWASAGAEPVVLGELSGGISASATDINASGQIAGCSSTELTRGTMNRPGLQWSPAGGTVAIWSGASHAVTGAGACSVAGTFVNDSGVIAGGNLLFTPH